MPLLASSLTPGSTLAETIHALVTGIDPYNDIALSPPGTELPAASIAVGADRTASITITAERYTAILTRDPKAFGDDPSTVIGACLAACLGAASLLHLVIGATPVERSTSLWSLMDSPPTATGPGAPPPPLDLGHVAVVGAGAVGSALAYWLRIIGITGTWEFVDGDVVELHNTSRALGLLASHAGWTSAGLTDTPENKADVTATLLEASSYVGWYDNWLQHNQVAPDLIVPAANGPGLRAALGQRGEPILVHSATSRQWTADLHRHLPEPDGCISCRLPDTSGSPLACSTSPIQMGTETVDAALPFLSGAAGLLLAAGLQRIVDGRIQDGNLNHWQLHLDANTRRTLRGRRWVCGAGCTIRRTLPQLLRRKLPRGQRWAHLD